MIGGWAPEDVLNGAACRDKDPTNFDDVDDFTHPDLSTEERHQLARERRLRARIVCSGCPVQLSCLRWSLEQKIPDGVYGGLSSNERKNLRRGRDPLRVATPRDKTNPASAHRSTDQIVRSFMGGSTVEELVEEYGTVRQVVLRAINQAVV